MIPRFEDLNPKLQGFFIGVGVTLLTVFVTGMYLTHFYHG
jgi:hypothetical protein